MDLKSGCGCLMGTLAKARAPRASAKRICFHWREIVPEAFAVPDNFLAQDMFARIKEGDKPETNPVSRLADQFATELMLSNPDYYGPGGWYGLRGC